MFDGLLNTADKVSTSSEAYGKIFFFHCLIGKVMAQPDCHEDQYRVGDRCCYACDPGSRVYRDCPEGRQTRCQPCAENTFHKGLNRHKHCTPCTRCDADRGLLLKRSCTETSDTMCDTLDGYFCRDPHEGGCREAQRHSVRCSPGHRIGQKGTAVSDTECLECPNGTFSNGTVTACQPHTECESQNLTQIQPGTASTNSVCVAVAAFNLIPGLETIIAMFCGAILLIIASIFWCIKKARERQRSSPHSAVQTQEAPHVEPNEGRQNNGALTILLEEDLEIIAKP
ncbi:tumor necrosis factor receptor superfamily member 14-like [Gadus macrocephalus]|uniref:tumor necrosis factor receptor superfamily member 14-like n=1 Tax=Gadus macrocephalus TaxID=80720 RepID=UPI0028CB5390|nr:tumor necrosis factor receptor superfamily member 14-like [Gadus macrocephalus]